MECAVLRNNNAKVFVSIMQNHSKLLGTHGIALPHRVSTNQALILALKSNNYKLFVDGKLI